MSDTEVADLATQEAALKRLSEAYDEAEWPAAREIEREMDRLETRISEFKKEFDVFLDDDMARSALYSYITDEGQLATLRGAPLSLDLESIDAAETSRPQSARQHQKERSAHSERLLRMLSAQRTMALQATIEQQPGLALVVLASRLATSLFYQGYSQSAVKVSASDGSFAARSADSGITESAAWNHMESASAKWSARLPGEASEAFAWFASQEQSVVIDFIAYCTAKSVDAVSASEQDSVGSDLARDVCLDMKKWRTASAQGYFLHVTKAHIVDVVTEQISAEDGARVAAMKKGEAAAVAEALLAPKKWLPAPWLPAKQLPVDAPFNG